MSDIGTWSRAVRSLFGRPYPMVAFEGGGPPQVLQNPDGRSDVGNLGLTRCPAKGFSA